MCLNSFLRSDIQCEFDLENENAACKGCAKQGLLTCTKLTARQYAEVKDTIRETSETAEPMQVETVPTIPTIFEGYFSSHDTYLYEYHKLYGISIAGSGQPTLKPRHFDSRFGGTILLLNVEYFLPTSLLHGIAILVLMSRRIPVHNDPNLRRPAAYIKWFDKYAEEARAKRDYISCLTGYYVMTQYTLMYGECISECIPYCNEFCRAFKNLKDSPEKDNNHLAVAEWMWQQILWSMFGVLRRILRKPRPHPRPQSEPDCKILKFIVHRLYRWSCLLVSEDDLKDYPQSMNSLMLSQKIVSLAMALDHFFDFFLFDISLGTPEIEGNPTAYLSDQLLSISAKLFRATSHLLPVCNYIYEVYDLAGKMETQSQLAHCLDAGEIQRRGIEFEPRCCDAALALIYYFTGLLKAILNSLEEKDETRLSGLAREMKRYAIAICIFATCLPSQEGHKPMATSLKVRSLFFAGSVLAGYLDEDGNPFSFKADVREICTAENLGCLR